MGWRKFPSTKVLLVELLLKLNHIIAQVFIGKGDKTYTDHEFNVKLFIARKNSRTYYLSIQTSEANYFYLPSLSTHTLIYKGLLVPEDIEPYYTDLSDPLVVTRLALVHQRFSTNTFPTWDLAQPFRYMCHNGEINTFRGNYSRMQAREELFKSDLFGDDIKRNFTCHLEREIRLLFYGYGRRVAFSYWPIFTGGNDDDGARSLGKTQINGSC